MGPMRLACAAAAALLAAGAARADDGLPAEGQPAPGFRLRALNPAAGAAVVDLEGLVGEEAEDLEARVVLLSFSASWCLPCRKELPVLQELDREFRGRGLRVIAVNIDRDEAGIAEARRQLEAAQVTFPVVSDRFNLLARRYLGERSPLPSVFLIRRDGIIARVERGYGREAPAFLRAEVRRALGPSRAAAAAPK